MTVLGRIHPNRAKERPPHDLGAAEATLGSDGLDADRGLLESPPRGFDPCESGRRHPDLTCEHAGKVTHAHRGPPRECHHRKVGTRMRADPHLEIAEWLPVCGLSHQLHTELRLATRAL